MFVESGWRPTWEPPPRRPKLTPRQERLIMWVVGINVALMIVAPIGGATIIQALLAAVTRG